MPKHRFQCEDCGRVVDVELRGKQLGPVGGCVCGDDDWIPQGPTPEHGQSYRVVWEIDIDADTPEDAARQALDIQHDYNSDATVFDVIDESGTKIRIDLLQMDEDNQSVQSK